MRNAAGKVMWGTTKVAIAAVVALSAALALMLALPSVASAAPANDNFASAETISSVPASVNGTNIGATEEIGEREPSVADTHSSVWYSWTAPETGQVTIDACDTSDFITVLSVHMGSALDTLTHRALNTLGCRGEDPNSKGSKLTFGATGGKVYHIRVATYFSGSSSYLEQGDFTLDLVLADDVAPDTTITEGPNRLTTDDTPLSLSVARTTRAPARTSSTPTRSTTVGGPTTRSRRASHASPWNSGHPELRRLARPREKQMSPGSATSPLPSQSR
jgi:hypothetical protein